MPQAAGPTTVAMAVVALIAVTPFVVIAVVNVVFALRGWTPLTQLVEHYLRRYPLFAAGLCGFFGALVGHIFWSFGYNAPRPPAPFHLLVIAVGLAIASGLAGAGLLALIAAVVIAPLMNRFGPKHPLP